MLSSYIVASFVLASLSTARPHHGFTVSTPLNATTSTSTGTSLIIPTGTTASFDAQITTPAQLSKRQENYGGKVQSILCVIPFFKACPKESNGVIIIAPPVASVTVTVTSELETSTVTAPGITVTAPGTTISAPGTTVSAPGTTVTAAGTTITAAGTTVTAAGTTITAPGTTVTAPGTPITYTVTFTSQPGETTKTVTTTLVALPSPTKTKTVLPPQGTGCHYPRPDGSIGIKPC